MVSRDASQPLNRIRIAFHHANQDGGLGIRPCTALLPIFQRAHVRAQIARENGAGEIESLAQGQNFPGCDDRRP